MNHPINQPLPKSYAIIEEETKQSGFTMSSDPLTGTLLRMLAASKPSGCFLDLGTGTGLSASWILDGMDERSTLISVDHDPVVQQIAKRHLGMDRRLALIESDGAAWFDKNTSLQFDYIFADTWHGKFFLLDEALGMLNPGGFYIIDDMLPQPNWPEGHAAKVDALIDVLERRADLWLIKQNWATGVIVGVKKG